MLNGIWLSFFIAAFVAALWQWLGVGDSEVFSRLVAALFDIAQCLNRAGAGRDHDVMGFSPLPRRQGLSG